jgi:5,10-methylenetetrahydromethanopterin reductase
VRMGLQTPGAPGARPWSKIHDIVAMAEEAEQLGFQSVWLAGRWDALTLVTLATTVTTRIELGTAVVPTYPRHPLALAQQTLAAHAASKGRVTLGIGVGQRTLITDQLGMDYDHPIRHLREYIPVLRGILNGDTVNHEDGRYPVTGLKLTVPGATPPPQLMVAALGPQSLKVAGQLTDGTLMFLAGPRYLEEVAVPIISAAAREAGRPVPRISNGVPVCVTSQREAGLERATTVFGHYGQQPAYRAILDRDGSATPTDISLVGDAKTVMAGLDRFASLGITDFNATVFGDGPKEINETLAVLADYARTHTS